MIIVGLNHGEINSSAALYRDGKICFAAPEERFNRRKRTKRFPIAALAFCLSEAGVTLKDVDFVAQGWNPGAGWQKYNPLISTHRIRREDYFYSIPDHLQDFVHRKSTDWTLMEFAPTSDLPPIYYVQHHRAHAANAFFLSPFEDAAILTVDWRGEYECLTMGRGTGNSIDTFVTQQVPDSLGMFYATFTELLGYEPDSDEWKVMALSAFDLDCEDLVRKIRSTVEITDDGLLRLDQSYYKGALVDQPRLFTDKLVELLGGRLGIPGTEPDEWHIRVARAMQIVSEEVATNMLNHLFAKTRCENLVVGGGFFMNSVFNGKILDRTSFKNMYIPYAPTDVGNSIGAALYVAHCIKAEQRKISHSSSYIGPEYSDDEIRQSLERRRLVYQELECPVRTVAELLAEGRIVAHFDGKMEFGERALGNRSILADPRDATMKNKINSIIKYREYFRPFAPAVLAERASDYFDVSSDYECQYMEKVVPVRVEHRTALPAITHIDGSGRLQTVKRSHNERFYAIIDEFQKLAGIPVVLNTSFNINGEPIVLSPDDALNTFFNSGLAYLVIGRYLVVK